ncbi:MAG TPA: hypothetical protein VFD17_07220 [Clostridia bacterium]|nr:hypothetical protein [Clostridia bacterium]
MRTWLKDKKTGIKCGTNDQGELFLGDDKSGYNLPDTPRNRQKMISDFCKQTGWQYPIMMRNGKPIGGEQGTV